MLLMVDALSALCTHSNAQLLVDHFIPMSKMTINADR